MPADAPPTFEILTLHTDGATAQLALNRPQRLNALTPLSMHELIAAAQWFAALPEMAMGIPLTWGGVPLLVRLLGPTVAMELVLDAEVFDAATALRWRFVNCCVPPQQLDQAGREWAARLAQRPLLAMRATKRRFHAVADALCTSRGSEADADDLLAAYRDPETQVAWKCYLAARQR